MKTKHFFRSMLVCMSLLAFVYSCERENDNEEDEDDIENTTTSPRGVWVRTLGASGDKTDIAIGGIANEAENRVYMCEYKGTVGLYKGYIDGNTIVWDSSHNLPNASAKLKGTQLELYYPSVSYSIPTLYDKGNWSGNCGALSGGTSGSTNGKALFWTSSDLGCGSITVTLSGSTGTISQYYSSGTPDCGASGCANFSLPAGSYNFTAKCSTKNWSGTITITADGCSRMRLTS